MMAHMCENDCERLQQWRQISFWKDGTCFFDLSAYRDWVKIPGVGEDGCVLVRPDHFVAWGCKKMDFQSVQNQLQGVIIDGQPFTQ
jgi:hypothetical protein